MRVLGATGGLLIMFAAVGVLISKGSKQDIQTTNKSCSDKQGTHMCWLIMFAAEGDLKSFMRSSSKRGLPSLKFLLFRVRRKGVILYCGATTSSDTCPGACPALASAFERFFLTIWLCPVTTFKRLSAIGLLNTSTVKCVCLSAKHACVTACLAQKVTSEHTCSQQTV